jgi:plasmid maintenance system antidote protein VapI
MPMKNPPHPGDLIKTEVIEALGLNVSKAADIRHFLISSTAMPR